MEPLVLDCSVTVAWCFQDERSSYADGVLDHLSANRAIVPSLWQLEVANALLVAERRDRLDEARTVTFLTLLESLPITVDQEASTRTFRDVLNLARAQNLSAYDAAYLELAMRRGLPLATIDERLANAAVAVGTIFFAPPEGAL